MFSKGLVLLLIFSLAFNIAFAGVWVYNRAAPSPLRRGPLHRRGPSVGRRPGPPPAPWAGLRLSAEQERGINEGRREFGQQMYALREQAAEDRDKLFELMATEEPDQPAVMAAQKRIEAVQQQMRKLAVERMFKTRDRLSPEQREEWLRLMKAQSQRLCRRWRDGETGPREGRGRRLPMAAPGANGPIGPGREVEEP